MLKCKLYIIAAAMALVGCSQNDIPSPDVLTPADGSIRFQTEDNWGATKGTEYGSTNFNEMEVFAFYTAQTAWGGATANDIDNFMYEQKVEKQPSGVWSYSPIKYWPNNANDKITFYSFSPCDEIETSIDPVSGKPLFNYEAGILADDNNDLTADVIYDQQKDVDGVKFEMKHALTKISLRANIIDSNTENGVGDGFAYSNETYHIFDVTLHNVYNKGDLKIADDKALSWTLDESSTLDNINAAQGVTLLSAYINPNNTPAASDINTTTQLNGTLTSVMAENKAIFVLPQELGADNRGGAEKAPKISISVLRSYYANAEDETDGKLTQIIYKTDQIEIPKPAVGKEGWEIGMHNRLSFTFDLELLNEFDTPMTLVSEIRPWNEVDIDVNIHPNIYLYANTNLFELASTDNWADMYIYTNYDYDLRVPRSKFELDGSKTDARGFTFYAKGSTTAIAPEILDTNGNPITFETKPDGVYANDEKLDYFIYGENPDLFLDKFFVMDDYYVTNVGPAILDKNGDKVDIKWLKCRILNGTYYLYYYVGLTTRYMLGLYNNTTSSVENGSAGINKEASDAVYILRLEVDNNKLSKQSGYGYFEGAIGAELLANGGGMITYKNSFKIKKEL